jgi:type II secretory pathway component PulF
MKKWQKLLKIDEKLRLYSLALLLFFAHLLKMAKVAKNRRKVKAMALLFCCFLPIYKKWQMSLKKDEKLRL